MRSSILYALCSMLYALCSMLYALCSMLFDMRITYLQTYRLTGLILEDLAALKNLTFFVFFLLKASLRQALELRLDKRMDKLRLAFLELQKYSSQSDIRTSNFSSQQTEDKIVFICGSKIDHFTWIGYHFSKASTKSFNHKTNKNFPHHKETGIWRLSSQ